jgi:hypothetical protein
VQIVDSNGNVLASQTSSQVDGDVVLPAVALAADGTYQIEVSGQNGSTGNYQIG